MLELTEKEKAAILLYLIEGTTERAILYEISEGENKANKLRPNRNSFSVTCSKWFRSHRIQAGIEYYTNLLDQIKNKAVQDYVNSSGDTEGTTREQKKVNSNDVNFLNPDEFMKFANERANEITDEKERREYLKMIANLMNYKESDQEQTDIQRFYTPVLCESCEIYNKCKNCRVSECPKML